jgi:ribosome-associated protein
MAGQSREIENGLGVAGGHSALASWAAVKDSARFLIDEKAVDVQVLQVSERSSFADFFVLATASSSGHLRGLVRNLDEVLARHGVWAKGGRRGVNEDDTWILLDCGDFIVHLMLQEAREFYDLEKLWFDSPRLVDQV